MATVAQTQIPLIPAEPMRVIQVKVTEEASKRIRVAAARRTAAEGRSVGIGQVITALAMEHLPESEQDAA